MLVDEDDRAYMYYGGGSTCLGGELNEDMLSLKNGMTEMEGLEDFHEAAWVFKRNGLYYLTYADNLEDNNRMRYATSENPLGPWMYRGIFLEPTGCSTTHGSVVEFKDQWYLFYHNQSISGEGNLRSVCIDYLEFNEDGTIKPVIQTKEGVSSIGTTPEVNPYLKTYPAADCMVFWRSRNTDVRIRSTGGEPLTNRGFLCSFNNIQGGEGGRASIELHYATSERLAKVNLYVNDKDYSLLNALSTGGAQQFSGRTNITVNVLPGAINTLRITGGHGEISIIQMTISPLVD